MKRKTIKVVSSVNKKYDPAKIIIGEKITLYYVKRFVEEKIRDYIFSSFDYDRLALLFKLEEGVKYTVTDHCKACHFVTIKVGKKYINIKYNSINEIYPK